MHGVGHGAELWQRRKYPVQLGGLDHPRALCVALRRDLPGLDGAKDRGAIDAGRGSRGDEGIGSSA
jgi:hypothetical protein